MQIIILGMHRSGTSTVTRLVNMMGAHVGEPETLIGQNEENPKGFWERRDVIEANDALLAHHECEWFDLANWPYNSTETLTPPAAMAPQLETIIEHMNQHPDWVMKDPRMCHTLPYWRSFLNNACYVLVHRDPLEIAHSLSKRNEFDRSHALSLWEYAVTGMCNAVWDNQRYILMSYPDIIERPVESCKKLYEQLQLFGCQSLHLPDEAEIRAFIEPSLYRSKGGSEEERKAALTPAQYTLCQALESGKLPARLPLPISHKAKEVMQLNTRAQRMQMQKAAIQEELGRALQTISELEVRVAELYSAMNKARQETDLLSAQNNALAAAKAELDVIKAGKWWRLRETLLRMKDN